MSLMIEVILVSTQFLSCTIFLIFSPLCLPLFAILWDLQGVLLILMKYITHLTNYILWHAVEYSNCWVRNKKIIAVDFEWWNSAGGRFIQINNIIFQVYDSDLNSKKVQFRARGFLKKNSKMLIFNLSGIIAHK